jgi:hypothetical protein
MLEAGDVQRALVIKLISLSGRFGNGKGVF